MTQETVHIIAGPTACGKSALALERAKSCGGVIINGDSMQLYSALKIITAHPSKDDFLSVPHKLYGVIDDFCEQKSVAWWRQHVIKDMKQCFQNQQVPFIVGGTGMYLTTLLEGLSPIPESDPDIRNQLRQQAKTQKGLKELYHELTQLDPHLAITLKPADSQRIIRALEVKKTTGRSLLYWQSLPKNPLPYKTHKILINYPREVVVKRAKARLEWMFENGAIEEVKAMYEVMHEAHKARIAKKQDDNASSSETLFSTPLPNQCPTLSFDMPVAKALGVREIKAYLDNQISKKEAFEKTMIATRQLIKRQETWFRHQMTFDEIIY